MDDYFVLIHSPLVGPLTWSLVAEDLRRRGIDALVPTLHDDDTGLPYWPGVTEAATTCKVSALVRQG